MDDGGVLRRPSDPAPVVQLAPAPPDDTTSAVDRAALTVAISRLTLSQTAVTQAQARRVLGSYVTLARVRDLVADRTPSPDQGHPTPPAEERCEDAGVGPAQVCAATTPWMDAIEDLAPSRPDGGAPDHRPVMDPAEMTFGTQSALVWLPILSRRERDVLGYAPSMLSAAEIGSELFVSVNTVKAHLRSIYRKLGVTRRRDAVIQARRRGLL